MKQRVYFFFPYKEVGGVQLLFLRLSEALSKLDKFEVYLIDYKDGYMAQHIDKNSKVHLLVYAQANFIKFKNEDVVVFQSLPLSCIPKNLIFSEKTKLLFWNLHPLNFGAFTLYLNRLFKVRIIRKFIVFIFTRTYFRKQLQTIRLFEKNKSLCFMDSANVKSIEKIFNITVKTPIYLPLIIKDIQKLEISYEDLASEQIRCLWIGRICDFKVHILLYTIKEILKNYPKAKITIIGNGDYLDYLKQEVKNMGHIDIVFKDFIAPEDVKNEVKKNHIGLAMGTAALDMAKYGLPVISLDAFYQQVKIDYRFKWLHERKDYNLGEICENEKQNKLVFDGMPINILLEQIFKNYEDLSQKSFDYVSSNFDTNNTLEKFIKVLDGVQLYFEDIPLHLFEFNFLQKIRDAKPNYIEFEY